MDAERRARLEATTRYDPSEVEGRILERWLEGGYFHPPAEGTPADNFSVAIPPPNVTSALHMGHALNGTIQDALVRLNRMRGRNTLWVLGTDHASIAVHALLEKELRAEGTSRYELGREAFLERAWAWKEKYGSQIVEQLKRLGASCDYERERFTLDEGYVRAVYRVFVRLYEKGYIYRDNYMVNWDVGSRSVISDLEVENREVTDTLYSIAYSIEDSDEVLTVATVRPETMLADTAVAVNPTDERYKALIGRHCVLPLVGRRLPVIADEHVDPEFGTGALKITPGHDPNDFEIGRAHGLEEVVVIGEDGRMTAEAGERFTGLTVAEAHEAVVTALREEGQDPSRGALHPLGPLLAPLRGADRATDLVAVVLSHGRARGAGDRGRRAGPGADHPRATQARLPGVDAEHPPLVHLPPALVGAPAAGLVLRCLRGDLRRRVGARALRRLRRRAAPGRRGARHLVQLRAVAVRDPRLARRGRPVAATLIYPTDVLVTARDILFLWVARMVMMGIEFAGEVPFDDVYITSIIQAPDGRRMSKSLGTGIDPRSRDRRPWRRRRPFRAAGDVLDPGRALLGGQDPAGP